MSNVIPLSASVIKEHKAKTVILTGRFCAKLDNEKSKDVYYLPDGITKKLLDSFPKKVKVIANTAPAQAVLDEIRKEA